jgi:hypothetical protein
MVGSEAGLRALFTTYLTGIAMTIAYFLTIGLAHH